MGKITCVWLGPPGSHNIAGDVSPGRKITLDAADYDVLLRHGLVKADKKPDKKSDKKEK